MIRRKLNSTRVISALRKKKCLSKKEIAYICRLSLPTVDSIIRLFLNKGIVKEAGYETSSGGRRPMLYQFNDKIKYAIGVDFEIPELTVLITDLSGSPVNKSASHLPVEAGAGRAIQFVGEQIGNLVKNTQLRNEDVVGIGFGAPAFIRNGEMTLSGKNLPPWRNVPVKRMLEEMTGVPVTVDNDVNLMTLSESHHMKYQDEVLVYLTLRRGTRGDIRMGGGVLLKGEVFHGAHGNAGTLRHAYMNLPKRMNAEEAIEEAIADRDPQEMVEKLKNHLVIPMINMISLFDPDRAVINADILGESEPLFIQECEEELKRHLPGVFNWDLRLEPARDREFPCAKGAALSILQALFKNPDVFFEKL
ncbi:MAG: ROK family protein [Candidatus Aerophobetes bacterium]